eukprot:Skav203890  [mRNA]  locus=scaffold1649:121537:124420:+ [translate_table: standard]
MCQLRNATELQLPALDTEQRKKAKKLAEEYPEIKCESYGFGAERCLLQRYNVQLSSADGSNGQSAKIKGENLRMYPTPAPPMMFAAR